MPGRDPLPEQVGDLLGSYELLRLLGEGSMGRVFEARHTTLGRHVAIKVLLPEHARDAKLLQRFFREAKAVNQINHRHIVEVFDFVEPGPDGADRAYCVMERLDGLTLAELFAQGPLSIERAVTILRQVCAALEAAHQVGVVHRDLKPENIVVEAREGGDFAKVLDFGVAKLLVPDPTTSATVDGAIVGTPQYMAPEQAASLEVDHRADVYGVGCLLYLALAGKPAFPQAPLGQLLVQIITQPPEPLPACTPRGERIPDALANLISRCLEKEPSLRPQTMAELDRLLAPFADPRSLERARRTERNARLLLAVAATTVLTGGILMLPRHPATDDGHPEPLAAPSVETVRAELRTDPPGATVVRADTGALLGRTPLEIELTRSHDEVPLRFDLSGFSPAERRIRPSANMAIDVSLSRVAPASAVVKDAEAAKNRVARDAVVDPFQR